MTWTIGTIDGGQRITHTDAGDIHVQGKIDGNSIVTLVSTGGSITIDGKIDGSSTVRLDAALNIEIGVIGNPGDMKIDGGSDVTAVARQGSIKLGNKIDNGSTRVTFRAATGIEIIDKIDGNALVKFWTGAGQIHVYGKVGQARGEWWPANGLVIDGAREFFPSAFIAADW